MWKRLAPALLLTALASCGASSKDDQMTDTTMTRFTLTSRDFSDGHPVPKVHTCDGSNQSPALSWDQPPSGTLSLVLIVDDPDAPSGTFHHWGAFDIAPSTRSIAAGDAVGKQAMNDGGKSGYMGPCPPTGHGVHHYRFKLYAIDVNALDVPANAKIPEIEAEAQRHQLGIAMLTGTYERN